MADAVHTPTAPTIISRSEAKAANLQYYFTGLPCRRNGHIAERYVLAGNCVACKRKSPKDPSTKKCSVEGCEKNKDTKGFCPKHYNMWKKYGDPLKTPQWDFGAGVRWLEEYKNYDGDDCLIWPFGSCGRPRISGAKGYGQSTLNGKNLGAHVHMAILVYGDRRSEGYIVAHACGKGHEGCCAPRHLRWSTHKENTADRYLHGTVPFGSFHPLARLTEEDVREIRRMKGVVSATRLAEKFGVGKTTVNNVLHRRTWCHVD